MNTGQVGIVLHYGIFMGTQKVPINRQLLDYVFALSRMIKQLIDYSFRISQRPNLTLTRIDIYFLATNIICSLSTLNCFITHYVEETCTEDS